MELRFPGFGASMIILWSISITLLSLIRIKLYLLKQLDHSMILYINKTYSAYILSTVMLSYLNVNVFWCKLNFSEMFSGSGRPEQDPSQRWLTSHTVLPDAAVATPPSLDWEVLCLDFSLRKHDGQYGLFNSVGSKITQKSRFLAHLWEASGLG